MKTQKNEETEDHHATGIATLHWIGSSNLHNQIEESRSDDRITVFMTASIGGRGSAGRYNGGSFTGRVQWLTAKSLTGLYRTSLWTYIFDGPGRDSADTPPSQLSSFFRQFPTENTDLSHAPFGERYHFRRIHETSKAKCLQVHNVLAREIQLYRNIRIIKIS